MSTFQGRRVHRRSSVQAAFTRAELAALLAALALLAMVVLPALANTGQRAQRLTCVSNLREIGQSFIAWSSEFGNRLPMQVPVTEGGTWNYALGNNAWFQFYTLSNHVRTPRIFVCPSDPEKRPADSLLSVSFDGGFIHVTYRNNALSYVIGHPLIEARPDILSTDRNLAGSFLTGGCTYWGSSRSIPRPPFIGAGWTDTLHNNSGNVLFGDGRVEQLSSLGLRQRLAESASEGNTEFHYLAP
jgi:prepilin-type processing-associated H-X9-DG protein